MSPRAKLYRHTISFHHAFEGIIYVFKTQPNMIVHLCATVAVVILGTLYHISRTEWLILLFTILWVIVSEMINTSIETMVDLITKEHRIEAKIAKDVAAGMVLIGAIGAIIVGLVIFLPYIVKSQ